MNYLNLVMTISLMTVMSCSKSDDGAEPTSVKDAVGNSYSIVKIGTQSWMGENLKTTKYNDGSSIPLMDNAVAWQVATTDGYTVYDNSPVQSSTYGHLYNHYAIRTGKLCPKGWRIPTNEDWSTLTNYLIENGYNYDGTTDGNKYAKSLAATTYWASSATAGAIGNTDFPEFRNKTGFSALPGGYRYSDGTFYYKTTNGYFWSSTFDSQTGSSSLNALYYNTAGLGTNLVSPKIGASCRCVKE